LAAETGIIRISRGDYIQALDLFRSAVADAPSGFTDYWPDTAYIAERVLTIAELKNYSDSRVPPDAKKPVNTALRSILARRLMRAGRRKEALQYFDDPAIRTAAKQYADALDKAQSLWRWPGTRAEAWFTAALLARADGMELLGFEGEPDSGMWDGNFDRTEDGKHDPSFQTEDERKRAAASRAVRDVRFQYRLTAVDHATASADLLPHSSQAFAAVLCEASTWVIDRHPDRAAEIYKRYIHQGAHMPWAASFGRTCPVPDFAAASSAKLRITRIRRHAKAHPLAAALAATAAVALIFFLTARVRRKIV
jgi:hypothetical protein